MDPFEVIDPFLHDLVLQHFAAAEVLTVLSFVNTEWSQIAGRSRKCMDKIQFVYQVWRHQFYSSTEVFQSALNSWRQYRHVIVELGVNDDSQQFWKFMNSCCNSIRTLKIENIRGDGQHLNADFPNLESFTAFGIDDKSLETFLRSTKKLKSLFIFWSESSMDQSAIKCLKTCFLNNRKLQDLYLKNRNFLRVFESKLKTPFRLKSLKLLKTVPDDSLSSVIEENILKFLKQQSASLETFFFEYTSKIIVEFAFNKLPALTSVGLFSYIDSNLHTNNRIGKLEIPNVETFGNIKTIIDATPNLESLFVGEATNELIDYLAWNFMKLQTLNFKAISLDGEEHYEQLKSEHQEVNQNIDIWDYENVDWD